MKSKGALGYSMEQSTHPCVGPSGFITIHQGFAHVYFLDVADILNSGFSLNTLTQYMNSKEQTMESLPVFGMCRNSHAFYPCGTFPVVVGIPTAENSETPTFVSYVVNSVLDVKAFKYVNAAVRAEIVAYLNRSMTHGLEKAWVAHGNLTSMKAWVEAFNKHEYKEESDDNSFGGGS